MSEERGFDEAVEGPGTAMASGVQPAAHERPGGRRADHRGGGVRQQVGEARLAKRLGEAVDRRR